MGEGVYTCNTEQKQSCKCLQRKNETNGIGLCARKLQFVVAGTTKIKHSIQSVLSYFDANRLPISCVGFLLYEVWWRCMCIPDLRRPSLMDRNTNKTRGDVVEKLAQIEQIQSANCAVCYLT